MKSLYLFGLMMVLPLQMLFAQNHPPVAVNDTVETYGQMPGIIDVLANDYDIDGDSIVLLNVYAYPFEQVFIENQKVTFIPSYENYLHRIHYSIGDAQDPTLGSGAEIYINVITNPDAPVAVADTFELVELISYNLDILVNDFDQNGNTFKIKKISDISNCHVTISPDSLSVTVVADNNGQYGFFSYQIKETGGEGYLSQMAKVRIRIKENNDIPVAIPDTSSAIGGIPVYIPVLENDIDPQGDELELYSLGYAQNGTVGKSGDSIVYTPRLSFKGDDRFYYSIREKLDTTIYSYSAIVTIHVSKNPHCPVAVTDEITGISGTEITIDALANDYDPDGDSLQLMEVSSGTITADNKILLTTWPFFIGYDSITYRIKESNNDLSYSNQAKIYLNLALNPDYPEAVDDYASTLAGIPVSLKPLENDLLHSYDTLIMFAVSIVDKKKMGVIAYEGETATYYPTFQAEGVQKIRYYLKSPSANELVGKGYIYINIKKLQFSDSLQINAINAGVNANGYLFADVFEMPGSFNYYNSLEMTPHFKYPVNTQNNMIYNNNLWIGGYDSQHLLHLSSFRSDYLGTDWYAGPVSNVYDSTYFKKYGRVWKINKGEIEYHKQHYSNQNYAPVEAILNWPGNGNTSLGQSLQLAPYFDYNSDGFYNCMDGDYPLIRGDQTIFIMYNDDLHPDEIGNLGLKAEIHAMIYGYDAPQDTALFNTVFVHYDLINRSNEVYSDCLQGIYTDYDLGDALDDNHRCDVRRGSFYVYNGKKTDGVYGANPPAMSVTVLAGPFMDSDGIDNPSGGCDESVNGINFGNQIADDERSGLSRFNNYASYVSGPYMNASDYSDNLIYGYLNGYWDDSTKIEYGGDGHNSNGTVGPACRFMFPGDSDPLNWGTDCQFPNGGYNQGAKFWTEEQAWISFTDKRGLGVLGPFTFSPGQVQEIDLAYVVGQGNNGPGSSVNQLLRNIDSLRNKVSLGEIVIPNSSLGSKDATEFQTVTVYPNPTKELILITGLSSQQCDYTISNLFGKTLMQGRILASTRQEINVAKLPAGIYFIRINSGKSTSSGKFVKIN
jgi:hypothetical protein